MRRRRFLRLASATAGGFVLGGHSGPGLVRAWTGRPSAAWGSAAGDVAGGQATVWSRSDRASRMVVEWATTEGFAGARRTVGPVASSATDFTANLRLDGLPPGQRIFYRVSFEEEAGRASGLPVAGSFRTPPETPADVRFVWSADTAGQGWGINPAFGGYRMYETMRRAEPDFFVHCGDGIYADNPIVPEVTLEDGTLWRNLVSKAKSKVAETLEEFRGNYVYNLGDGPLRAFAAEVSQVRTWDDHEVVNNWYPGGVLEDARYTEKRMDVLASRARRAFLEYTPLGPLPGGGGRMYRSLRYGPLLELFVLDLRSDRGRNTGNRQPRPGRETRLLGRAQLRWLKAALAASRAAWKVMVSSLPVGLVVPDGAHRYEAWANADAALLGREHELADLLGHVRAARIRNLVWLTGDVHYAAAHHYDPERARWKGFDPFWEFVAGPLHAGTFGPAALDPTFGPELRYLSIPPDLKPNRPPSAGLQFYGQVGIDGRTRVMTVSLHDLSGRRLFATDIEPAGPS